MRLLRMMEVVGAVVLIIATVTLLGFKLVEHVAGMLGANETEITAGGPSRP